MNIFRNRDVLKPVSRFWPGYFLLLFGASCRQKQVQTNPEIRIAKIVPAVYHRITDTGFEKRQDTIYYQGKFFTGKIYSLFPGGDTEYLHAYFNGVEEGKQFNWYPGKQLAEERFFINGKKEGEQKGWWPDGKQKFLFTTYNDEYTGEFKEWYVSGLLGKEFHYVNGQESGSQKLWWDNGTIRANYVIKAGRKYGLLGLKTCSNPYDSIFKK